VWKIWLLPGFDTRTFLPASSSRLCPALSYSVIRHCYFLTVMRQCYLLTAVNRHCYFLTVIRQYYLLIIIRHCYFLTVIRQCYLLTEIRHCYLLTVIRLCYLLTVIRQCYLLTVTRHCYLTVIRHCYLLTVIRHYCFLLICDTAQLLLNYSLAHNFLLSVFFGSFRVTTHHCTLYDFRMFVVCFVVLVPVRRMNLFLSFIE
jgi:hypothetical protein